MEPNVRCAFASKVDAVPWQTFFTLILTCLGTGVKANVALGRLALLAHFLNAAGSLSAWPALITGARILHFSDLVAAT